MKEKKCKICGITFIPSGPAGLYCKDCGEARRKEVARKGAQAYRIRHNLVQKPGVGKGGNQKKGKDNVCYKNGSRFYQKMRKVLLQERKCCERCGKNLLDVHYSYRCLHHRDHNRDNNAIENLELLCKRCHQLEHNCTANLPNGKV